MKWVNKCFAKKNLSDFEEFTGFSQNSQEKKVPPNFSYLAKYIEQASLGKICCSENLASPALFTNNCLWIYFISFLHAPGRTF